MILWVSSPLPVSPILTTHASPRSHTALSSCSPEAPPRQWRILGPNPIAQRSSNSNAHQNHLGGRGLVKSDSWPPPPEFPMQSVGPCGARDFCISHKLPGDSDVAGSGTSVTISTPPRCTSKHLGGVLKRTEMCSPDLDPLNQNVSRGD